ncbi:hypothetical protein OG422_14385 [Streptomyces sp. NBC_01525]|uniref:hypothetical protein n=1 Tax=Streptomyces sp. NBC_01525 TaxID=2903893 RepID=UPI00386DE591
MIDNHAERHTRPVACYVPVCSLCGGSSDEEGFVHHFDSPAEALDYVTADADGGWTLTPGGLLVCDTVHDTAHEDIHAAAGKRMSPCAMTVTWDNAPVGAFHA